ncbi:MAG: cyclodeaminase/cyclohydrolase family protein [Desulfobacula sp.]|nr:cyclodeaminase/cyclohydrolase family protein [Desulfobacula sp.]
MTLIDLKLQDFTHEVASASPAPGGGSIAALCGSLGAALCHMVASLTLGGKKYKEVETFMLDVKKKSGTLQDKLLEQVDADTLAYNRVIKAFKLPKKTSVEINLRKQAIQDALKAAAQVPYHTLKTAASAMVLVETVIKKGNPNCITDAGVAAELIDAAVRGAAYNVFINLMDIKDNAFSLELRQKVFTIKHNIHRKTKQIRKTIEQSINMEP